MNSGFSPMPEVGAVGAAVRFRNTSRVARYGDGVEVIISDPARRYVIAHGGGVFVKSHSYRCCSAGSLTLLDVATSPPVDALDYAAVECEDVDVRFLGGRSGQPSQLVIELRGLFKPHLVAYWDGCVYKI